MTDSSTLVLPKAFFRNLAGMVADTSCVSAGTVRDIAKHPPFNDLFVEDDVFRFAAGLFKIVLR
jgi:hypothetical protein